MKFLYSKLTSGFLIATVFCVTAYGMQSAQENIKKLHEGLTFLETVLNSESLKIRTPQKEEFAPLVSAFIDLDQNIISKLKRGPITKEGALTLDDLNSIERELENVLVRLNKWIKNQKVTQFEGSTYILNITPSDLFKEITKKVNPNFDGTNFTVLDFRLFVSYCILLVNQIRAELKEIHPFLSIKDIQQLKKDYEPFIKFLNGKNIQSHVNFSAIKKPTDLTSLYENVLQDIQAIDKKLGTSSYDFEVSGEKIKLNKEQIIGQFENYLEIINQKIKR